MHLKKDCNLTAFLAQIKLCDSEVNFHTTAGDILALKSSLCQYIFLSLSEQPEALYKGEIVCENKADYHILSDFLY